jgi:hypothetical protein
VPQYMLSVGRVVFMNNADRLQRLFPLLSVLWDNGQEDNIGTKTTSSRVVQLDHSIKKRSNDCTHLVSDKISI